MPAPLNAAQLDAVRTLKGPLLVLAGAGTGKTRVVTYRIAELIRRGTKPERILAVTFTKKAAGEMQQRASELLVRGRTTRSRVSPRRTRSPVSKRLAAAARRFPRFHSLCVRILRRHIKRLGYPEKFVICDRNEQESQARTALRELRAPNAALAPGDLLGYRQPLEDGVGAAGTTPIESPSPTASIWPRPPIAATRTISRRIGAVDFDDLLLLTEELFEQVSRRSARPRPSGSITC